MFDQILDTYRRAAESTMQFQQTMLRNWIQQQWPPMFGVPNFPNPGNFFPNPMSAFTNPGTAWLDQAHDVQTKWGETVTGMLNKHRESLDAQYRAGIKTIEDVFRLGEAKDPEQLRKLTEELWKHSFEALKSVTEDQTRELQTAMQKWLELVSQSTGVKV